MDQPVNQNQSPDRPVEGTVIATGSSPVGFAGGPMAPVAGPGGAPAWQQGYWAATPVVTAPVRRRRRWVPFALAGAGVVLLVGGGAGGYAIGHSSAGTTGTTAQTGTLVPGTDGGAQGQLGGSADGSTGQFGTPPDLSGGFGSQLGQQGGTTDGTTGTTDSGTAAGTTT